MEQQFKQRSLGVDILKCIAALLIVILHYGGVQHGHDFTSIMSQIVNSETRIAVPAFFMITGYYYPYLIKKRHFTSHLTKLLKLTAFATLFYISYAFIYNYNSGYFYEYINTWTLHRILVWIVGNGFMEVGHLWFLYAVIYDLLIIFIVDKIGLSKWLNYSAIGLYIIFLVCNITPFYIYTRNWLFFGLPYILLGRSVAEGKMQFIASKLTNKLCLRIIALCAVLIVGEAMVYSFWIDSVKPWRDCYLFSLPCVFAVFCLAIKRSSSGGKMINTIAAIGRKHSANIYILHIFCGHMIYSINQFGTFYQKLFIGVPLIFITSLLISMFYVYVRNMIMNRTYKATS